MNTKAEIPITYIKKEQTNNYHQVCILQPNGHAPAFMQALHDGLEFKLIEERDAWMQIELTDGRRCWIPKNQASRLPAL